MWGPDSFLEIISVQEHNLQLNNWKLCNFSCRYRSTCVLATRHFWIESLVNCFCWMRPHHKTFSIFQRFLEDALETVGACSDSPICTDYPKLMIHDSCNISVAFLIITSLIRYVEENKNHPTCLLLSCDTSSVSQNFTTFSRNTTE